MYHPLNYQALEDSDSGPGAHQHWSFPAARKWLLERQNADGGWGDVAKTAAAVAALTPASLAVVRPPHCSDKLLDSRHEPFGKSTYQMSSTTASGIRHVITSFGCVNYPISVNCQPISFSYTVN